MKRSRYACPSCGRKLRWIERWNTWRCFGLLPRVVPCPECETELIWSRRSASVAIGGSLSMLILALAWFILDVFLGFHRADDIFGPLVIVVSLPTMIAALTLRIVANNEANKPSERTR